MASSNNNFISRESFAAARLSYPPIYLPAPTKIDTAWFPRRTQTSASYPCPSANCLWSGPMEKMPLHFIEKHREFVKEKLEITIDLREDAYRMIMVVVNDVAYLAYFSYDCHFGRLVYDMRCLSNDYVWYGMQVLNNETKNCAMMVGAVLCPPLTFNGEAGSTFLLRDYLFGPRNSRTVVLSIDTVLPTVPTFEYSIVARN